MLGSGRVPSSFLDFALFLFLSALFGVPFDGSRIGFEAPETWTKKPVSINWRMSPINTPPRRSHTTFNLGVLFLFSNLLLSLFTSFFAAPLMKISPAMHGKTKLNKRVISHHFKSLDKRKASWVKTRSFPSSKKNTTAGSDHQPQTARSKQSLDLRSQVTRPCTLPKTIPRQHGTLPPPSGSPVVGSRRLGNHHPVLWRIAFQKWTSSRTRRY